MSHPAPRTAHCRDTRVEAYVVAAPHVSGFAKIVCRQLRAPGFRALGPPAMCHDMLPTGWASKGVANRADRRWWRRLPGQTSIGDGAAAGDKKTQVDGFFASQSMEPPLLAGAALRRAVPDQIFWYVRTIFPRAGRKTDTLLTLHELGGCFGAGALARLRRSGRPCALIENSTRFWESSRRCRGR
jgi:hypothetical protein